MPILSRKRYRRLMFIVGIIATISYRIIIVFNFYSPFLVQIFWYIGTLGFIWYFSHRFKVEDRRDKIITEMNLAYKIENNIALSDLERKSLAKILSGLQTSLSKWNYIVIFISSALALTYGIIQDMSNLLK